MAGLQVSLLFLTVCWWSGCVLAQLDDKLLLEVHNKARSSVDPPAKNMLKMEWNDELARVAQNYAKTCQFENNDARHTQVQTSNFTKIGENIYVFSGSVATLDYTKIVEEWNGGKPSFNERENSCDENKKTECEFYLQLVSATTHAVGCGVAECSDDKNILVCNYGPMFNLTDGPPYVRGEFCSACPGDCDNKLCSRIPPLHPPEDCAPLHSEQCFCVDAQVSVSCDGLDSDMCNEGMQPPPITRCFCYKIDVSTRRKFTF